MTEEPTSPANAGQSGPVAGERLAEARRARNVSLDEIARELHLDEGKVRALEQNDFEHLGAAVFVKGYLRKYASLVGVSGDDVLADYQRLKPADAAPPIVGIRAHPRQRASPAPWIAALAVAGIAVLGAWWWFDGGTATPDSGSPPAEPARSPEPAEAEAVEEMPAPDVIEEEDAPAETAAETLDAALAPPPQATGQTPDAGAEVEPEPPATEPAAGHVALELRYTGDCWTEVTDAGGNRLYFGLGSDGRTVAVAGEPPLQVLLGDSENVRVTVDGSAYAIPPSARRGDTARFTITP